VLKPVLVPLLAVSTIENEYANASLSPLLLTLGVPPAASAPLSELVPMLLSP